ncbi:unnamed protein product [Ixodes pacificus]
MLSARSWLTADEPFWSATFRNRLTSTQNLGIRKRYPRGACTTQKNNLELTFTSKSRLSTPSTRPEGCPRTYRAMDSRNATEKVPAFEEPLCQPAKRNEVTACPTRKFKAPENPTAEQESGKGRQQPPPENQSKK